MKKRIMIGAMTCWMALSAQAQYQYDRALPLPTVDLYDTGVMNMYMRALAETSARRQQSYEQYSELAFDAFNGRQWSNVISYVGAALNTGYYCGSLYYVRGFAYEQLGNLKAAKKDYKVGKKYDCVEAAQALDALKAKRKAKR